MHLLNLICIGLSQASLVMREPIVHAIQSPSPLLAPLYQVFPHLLSLQRPHARGPHETACNAACRCCRGCAGCIEAACHATECSRHMGRCRCLAAVSIPAALAQPPPGCHSTIDWCGWQRCFCKRCRRSPGLRKPSAAAFRSASACDYITDDGDGIYGHVPLCRIITRGAAIRPIGRTCSIPGVLLEAEHTGAVLLDASHALPLPICMCGIVHSEDPCAKGRLAESAPRGLVPPR
mmetsp:Transcript_136783/g.341066  ORF Transcript_136783/g.341066 Transcript_136783/m.341066 type:complete len:235 (+) Transcript_136783:1669-2373(+)